MVEAAEDLLGLSGETVALTVEFDSPIAASECTAICEALRGNLGGAVLNGPAFVENGGSAEALDELARTLGGLGGSTGLEPARSLEIQVERILLTFRNSGFREFRFTRRTPFKEPGIV